MERNQRVAMICAMAAITILFAVSIPADFVGCDGLLGECALDPTDVDETEVFARSAAGDDYVDYSQSTTYGSHQDPPPAGMGEVGSATTVLTEGAYAAQEWTELVVQEQFTSKPAGWTDSLMDYSGGYFQQLDSWMAGYLQCPTYDTSSCVQIRFVLYIGGSWLPDGQIQVQFYDGTNWDLVAYYDETQADQTVTTTAAEYKHSSFMVRVYYGGFDGTQSFGANNWRLHKLVDITSYRFQEVYAFTGVDFGTYYSERLYVDFATGSDTDDLQFRFESGDTTPDNIITTVAGGQDFNVDIHSYLSGSECYVDIRDMLRTSDDESQSAWAIERMYIRLADTVPMIVAAPITDGLFGGSLILAEYNYVTVTANVSDVDGAGQINHVTLSIMDQSQTTEQFSVVYTEGNPGTFSEGTNPGYIVLDAGSCQVSKSTNGIDLVFVFAVDFDYYPIADVSYNLSVVDDDGKGVYGLYTAGWDVEDRLSISATIDDGLGTSDRGNVSGIVQTGGVVSYFGQPSVHPLLGAVDVSVECSDVSGSPWTATDYNETDGTFSVSVTADDQVGLDIYSFHAKSDGVDCLASEYSLTYIADRIVCVDLSSPSPIVDSTAPGYVNVRLQYEYDSSQVVNGTYWLEGLALSHVSGDEWQTSYEPEGLMMVTYDTITVESNFHGLSAVNMGSRTITMYWEELLCYVSGPTVTPIVPGENASGIVIWAEYYFWSSHGNRTYTGTLHLNDTTFIYYTLGKHGYTVSYADGDDEWDVFTIHSSNATYCIWEYPDDPPQWLELPSDRWTEYACEFVYTLGASIPCPPATWWLNDTVRFSIDGLGVVRNATNLPVSDYGVEVFVNDTYGRTISSEFTVYVRDRTAPSFQGLMLEYSVEFGNGFACDLDAYDVSGIGSWGVNNTLQFLIDGSGVITNATWLEVHIYHLNVSVYDTHGNMNSSVIVITVQDTTPPSWVIAPADQLVEYGTDLSVQFSASDLSEVSEWSVNNTLQFSIDGSGVITNATRLAVGIYNLNVSVGDEYGNTRFSAIVIEVQDTTAPGWIITPTDQFIECGADLSAQFSASDLSGVSHWSVNNTLAFAITDGGLLSNATALQIGTYALNISVYDIFNNMNSKMTFVIVADTSAPIWTDGPENQTVELGDPFSYTVSAHDLSELGSWWLEDTVYFVVDDGIISNCTILDVGVYSVRVWVNDTFGYSLYGDFNVTVEDTTPPSFVGLTPNHEVEFGEVLLCDLDAYDLSGVYVWTVNNTEFWIGPLGLLTNATWLAVGIYHLNVSVGDEHVNINSCLITVKVEDTTPPGWITAPTNQLLEYGWAFSVNFSASDLSGVFGWSVSGSMGFSISSEGLLENSTPLQVGTFTLNISVYDIYYNTNWTVVLIEVEDNTAPTWDVVPENKTVELGDPFSYRVSAKDLSELDSWWLDITTYFVVSDDGIISNRTVLTVTMYSIRVWVNDTYGNALNGSFTISVMDTTAPEWNVPGIQNLGYGHILYCQLEATDFSGTVYWSVNNTEQFFIDEYEILTSRATLVDGVYNLNVSVWDVYHNLAWGVIKVVVQPKPSEPPDMALVLVTIGIGVVGLVVSLHTWKLVQRGRAAHLGEDSQDLEGALEYLDKIPPPPDVEPDDNP